MDDALLREALDSEYEKSSQIKLCKYVLSLAKHILTLIDYKDMEHPVIQAGYAVNERWQRGDARMHDVRQAGFQIHQLAKSSPDMVTQTALRVAGQAVATGHMREHAMVSSDYAIKVINLRFPNDMNAVRQERLWQIEHLRGIADGAPAKNDGNG